MHGVGTAEAPGEMFFQKNLDHSTPGWVPRASITHKDRTIQYPLVNDPATLTWLAQIAALEIHVPQWRVDSHGNPMPPDRLVLDLDPGEGAGLAECVEVARLARTILQDVGLDPVPVTSGSKGIHLYAALDGTQSSEQISEFAHELARSLEADHPDLAVSDMKKTLRTGKVLVDWSQNSAAKTTIVPYSLRGRLRPTVAAPRTWRELSSPSLHQLDYQEVMQRVKAGKDRSPPSPARRHEPEPEPDGGTPRRQRTGAGRRAAGDGGGHRPAAGEVPLQAGRGGHPGAVHGRAAPCRPKERTRRRHAPGEVRHPGTPRQPAALRLPAGARRRAGVLGAAQGRPHEQDARTTWRSRPRTTRMDYAGLRRHHPQRPVRRRDHQHLGPRVLRGARSGSRARKSLPPSPARTTAAWAAPAGSP